MLTYLGWLVLSGDALGSSYETTHLFHAVSIVSLAIAGSTDAAPQELHRQGTLLTAESLETDVVPGALTFSSPTAFDFGSAGLGSTTFLRYASRWQNDFAGHSLVQEAVDNPGSASSSDYTAPAEMFDKGSSFSVTTAYASFSSAADEPDPILTNAPEPATWISGLAAFAVLAATQRHRVRLARKPA